MKKVLFTSLSVLLLASVASASNTGFKLNYDLLNNAGRSNNNPVSPPYFFFPDGNVANPTASQTDVGWCNDLNDNGANPRVTSIKRFNVLLDTFTTHPCAVPVPNFSLVVGQGYLLVPVAGGSTVSIVGSHDDTYAPNKTATPTLLTLRLTAGRSNNNYMSVPYHVMADNDVELCNMVNTPTTVVTSIKRFNVALDTFTTHPCAVPVPNFTLVPGASYAFVPNADNVQIGMNVY